MTGSMRDPILHTKPENIPGRVSAGDCQPGTAWQCHWGTVLDDPCVLVCTSSGTGAKKRLACYSGHDFTLCRLGLNCITSSLAQTVLSVT